MLRRTPVLLLLFAACAPAENAQPTSVPEGRLTVVATFGGIDERPEYEFGRVAGLAALPDGGVAVVDGMNDVVRIFDAGGGHRFSFGRAGEGPGEMSGVCCPAVGPDGLLWLRDGGNARYNAYRLLPDTAEFVRQIRMAHGDVNRWAPLTFDSTGLLIDIGTRSDQQAGTRATYRMHLDSIGHVVHDIPIHEVPEDSTGMKSVEKTLGENMKATLFFYPPFPPSALFAHSPSGEFAHMLTSRYAIDWRAPDGSLIRHITGAATEGPPLSDDERAAATERLRSDEQRAGTRLNFDMPERKQPISRLFFDRLGRLWVQLSVAQHDDRIAHVYDRDGTHERTVTWPAGIDLSEGAITGDTAWGIQTDSLGVAAIVKLTGLTNRR